jgi:RNA polymerase sigma factor (sigma-70 family)
VHGWLHPSPPESRIGGCTGARRLERVEPTLLAQRVASLPGSEALPCLAEFDPRNDLHLDAVACFLTERFRADNDVEALALLFELAHRRLREIARQVCRQLAVAVDPDDLVAGFMTRLFTDVRRPQPKVRHFLGLAHAAMRNDARNQLRQSARALRRNLSFHATLAEPADPSAEADQREQERGIARLGLFLLLVVGLCFHQLSARDRQALLLREVDGMPYDELAGALKLPANQVGSVLRRARERLMKKLASALLLGDGGDDGGDSGAARASEAS